MLLLLEAIVFLVKPTGLFFVAKQNFSTDCKNSSTIKSGGENHETYP